MVLIINSFLSGIFFAATDTKLCIEKFMSCYDPKFPQRSIQKSTA